MIDTSYFRGVAITFSFTFLFFFTYALLNYFFNKYAPGLLKNPLFLITMIFLIVFIILNIEPRRFDPFRQPDGKSLTLALYQPIATDAANLGAGADVIGFNIDAGSVL